MHLHCFFFSKIVAIYALLVCKIFGRKIRSCKFFDKSQVCTETVIRAPERRIRLQKEERILLALFRFSSLSPSLAFPISSPLSVSLHFFGTPASNSLFSRRQLRDVGGIFCQNIQLPAVSFCLLWRCFSVKWATFFIDPSLSSRCGVPI